MEAGVIIPKHLDGIVRGKKRGTWVCVEHGIALSNCASCLDKAMKSYDEWKPKKVEVI